MPSFNVDINSLELEDISLRDAPDFADAYIAYGEDLDGNPLTDDMLAKLNSDRDFVLEMVHRILY